MPKLLDYLAENPLYAYGQKVGQEGSSTAPVSSPWQGLARALQGTVGGLFEGQALAASKKERAEDSKILADAMAKYATDPQGAMEAISKRPMLSDVAQGLITQRAAADLAYQNKARLGKLGADSMDATFGAPAPGVAAAPGAPGAAGAPGALPTATEHDANNIGNIRPKGSATGFNRYETPQHGVAAAVQNVRAYPAAFNNGQPMTLTQIGERWAPKGDGNNDPAAWAKGVAAGGGLDPNKPLDFNDPQTALAFARGVHRQEKGTSFAPEVYQQGVQLAQAGPVSPSGAYQVAPSSGAPAAPGGNVPHAGDAEARAMWQRLRPMVASGQLTTAEAQKEIQADAQQRRQIHQTESGLNQRERFQAEQKKIEHTGNLRRSLEGNDNYKEAERARPIMGSLYRYAGDTSHASTLGLLQSVAQIIEPGSVSERGLIDLKRAGPVVDRVKAMIKEQASGNGLPPEQRAELVRIAEQRYAELARDAHARGLEHRKIADSFGLNPDHIYDPTSLLPPAPQAPPVVTQATPPPGVMPPPQQQAPPMPPPQQAAPMVQAPPPQFRPPPQGAPPPTIAGTTTLPTPPGASPAPPSGALTFGRDAQGRLVPLYPPAGPR